MGNSILENFRREYENDMNSIRQGEKKPTDDMSDAEKEGREMANKIWLNSKIQENPDKDKPHYSTTDLRLKGKTSETPLPNIVIVRATCPDCEEEIDTYRGMGKYKCPKCGKEYILDTPYPHLAIKLADGQTMMIDTNNLNTPKTHAEYMEDYRNEEIPSFDEIPENPNWDKDDNTIATDPAPFSSDTDIFGYDYFELVDKHTL